MSGRYRTEEEKAEALALKRTIGSRRAAQQTGIPRRTIDYWASLPAASPIMAAVEQDIAAMLKAAHAKALEAVYVGLSDPKARLGDKAQSLRVLGEQLALTEGRATSHNLNFNASVDASDPFGDLTPEEARNLMRLLDEEIAARQAELREGAADG